MTGRNEACHCGSGKKYKKCHGQSGQPAVFAQATPADTSSLMQQCRQLIKQRQFGSAWTLSEQLSKSAQTCKLQVDILVGRHEAGDLEKALQIIEQWKKLAPTDPEPWTRSLEIALNKGNRAGRQSAMKKLQAIAPGTSKTLYYQGLLAQLEGPLETALGIFTESARRQFPGYRPSSWSVQAASTACDIAIGKYPGSSESSFLELLDQPTVVAELETRLQSWDEENAGDLHSLTTPERTVIANAWQKLLTASMQGLINLDICQSYSAKALALNPNLLAARCSELFCLNYDPNLSPRQIYQRHLAAGDWLAKEHPQTKDRFLNSRIADRPLKVAYLSSDFCVHPVSHFILPVLRKHRPDQVRTYLYYNQQKQDEVTAQCAAAAHKFVSVWDHDDHALAKQIERDGIDILVDLNGASGDNRLSLLARRAAPVQVTWLGYPNTTGLSTVDYRIVDEITDPRPGAAGLNREKLIYLPRLFSVYDPILELPRLAPAPCKQNGFVTFGSFNNPNKLNAQQLALWSRLLQQVPDSKLLFKYPTLDYQSLRQDLLAMFSANGIAPTRILFQGLVKDRREHFEAFSAIDIHLDSFPYHGTTTSCESLVMGVPIVTLAGEDHRSRVGASLLHSVGHEEWVARTAEDYLRIASSLAADFSALDRIRSTLREELQHSALMDASTFTTELEQAYRDCWTNWCRQGGPVA